MSLPKAILSAYLHSLTHLHRIYTSRDIHGFILEIICYDCRKGFYRDKRLDEPFVPCVEMLGAEEVIPGPEISQLKQEKP